MRCTFSSKLLTLQGNSKHKQCFICHALSYSRLRAKSETKNMSSCERVNTWAMAIFISTFLSKPAPPSQNYPVDIIVKYINYWWLKVNLGQDWYEYFWKLHFDCCYWFVDYLSMTWRKASPHKGCYYKYYYYWKLYIYSNLYLFSLICALSINDWFRSEEKPGHRRCRQPRNWKYQVRNKVHKCVQI